MTIYFCPICKTKDHWANEPCSSGWQAPDWANEPCSLVVKTQERNRPVTIPSSCNQCVTKQTEIDILRARIAEIEEKSKPKAKRNRAEYMRAYRARIVS